MAMDQPQTFSASEQARQSPASLRRKPRRRESIIQAFLFACGILSIFITLGIVIVLGQESLRFFGSIQWELTNKPLAAAIDSTETELYFETAGASLLVDDRIRLSNEEMIVLAVNEESITVERGAQGTEAEPHPAGRIFERAIDPNLREFITGTEWSPHIGRFGILPLLTSTLIVTSIGIVVAVPLGLATAIYLSEYASTRVRNVLKPILEVLAGVPTVVYGYFALTFVTPLLRTIFGQDVVQIYNMAAGGIVIGILILPFVSTISEDALNAVPRSLREASYGLGATRLETSVRVVVPAAISGIAAAVIVAASRAVGETMIVALATGAGPAFTFNPFQSAETMTGHIVRISGGDLSYDTLDYNSIFAIGLVLFIMTLTLNIISQRIVRRFREVYE